MTNLALIKHLIGSNADLSDERLTVAAEFTGLVPGDEYDATNRCLVFGLVISEIQGDKGIKRFSEGDFSVEFQDSISASVIALAKKSGCPDLIAEHVPVVAAPMIKNVSNLW